MLSWFLTMRLTLAMNVSVLGHYVSPAAQSGIMMGMAIMNLCLNLTRPYKSIITSIAMWLLDATYLLVTVAFFIEEIGVLGTTGSE